MKLWTAWSHQMKTINEIPRNSSFTLKTPQTTRSPHETMSMNWRMSRRGLMNPLMNSDRICQLTHCAQIVDNSDATIEFEVQCRLIQAIPEANIELQKELLKVNHDKNVSDLLEISHTYYAVESGVAAMCTGKAIHALCQGHQPQKSKPQKCTSQCPNCTCSHSPGCDNCPAQNTTCNGCSKRGNWHAKCHSSGTVGKHATKPNGAVKAPCHWCRKRGRELI